MLGPIDSYDPDDVPRIDPSDPFSPPIEVCKCFCLRCGRTFMSDGIWLQRYRNHPPGNGLKGFWMCPTPNCEGRGFTFDIFPVDPDHPCNASWSCGEDEADDAAMLSIDEEVPEDWLTDDEAEYDPLEPQYRALDEACAECGDLEGEEWKYGLPPGTYPLDFMPDDGPMRSNPRHDPRYDEPDRRPREIDYAEHDAPHHLDDDMPF